jgi:hypothetical protein
VTWRWGRALAIAGPVLVSASCSETTVDPGITVPPSIEPTTTVFAPAGTTAELLDELVAESGRLSDLIVENVGQRAALARIETLWALVRADVEAERADLLPGFESAIGLLRTGVERRRPADADKAHNNLRTLAAAYGT